MHHPRTLHVLLVLALASRAAGFADSLPAVLRYADEPYTLHESAQYASSERRDTPPRMNYGETDLTSYLRVAARQVVDGVSGAADVLEATIDPELLEPSMTAEPSMEALLTGEESLMSSEPFMVENAAGATRVLAVGARQMVPEADESVDASAVPVDFVTHEPTDDGMYYTFSAEPSPEVTEGTMVIDADVTLPSPSAAPVRIPDADGTRVPLPPRGSRSVAPTVTPVVTPAPVRAARDQVGRHDVGPMPLDAWLDTGSAKARSRIWGVGPVLKEE